MRVDIDNEKGKFVRDTSSMAILAVDKTAIAKHEIIKNKLKKEEELKNTINNLQSEVSSLKSDISKILEILNSRGS